MSEGQNSDSLVQAERKRGAELGTYIQKDQASPEGEINNQADNKADLIPPSGLVIPYSFSLALRNANNALLELGYRNFVLRTYNATLSL